MSDNGKPELAVTSGSAWRKPREEGILITLPSGNVCRMRPVALDVMITSGKLPDLLTPVAAKTLWSDINPEELSDMAELATGMAELFSIVCKAAFIEPKIVDNPKKDDEISLDDIDFNDKAAAFQLAIQPAQVLEKFREQQERGLEAIYHGEDNKVATE